MTYRILFPSLGPLLISFIRSFISFLWYHLHIWVRPIFQYICNTTPSIHSSIPQVSHLHGPFQNENEHMSSLLMPLTKKWYDSILTHLCYTRTSTINQVSLSQTRLKIFHLPTNIYKSKLKITALVL